MKLKVSGLSKKYGEFLALDNVAFEMEEGIYAILGLNGAGKSTLINLITDNLKRTSGEITLDGEDVLKMGSKYRELIGYMPQEQAYIGEFTARSYLYYMAELKGIRKKEAKSVITRLLNQFNLENSADKKMSTFSGGMKQRTILCQALLANPKILILDEPTAGLDIRERINFKEYIKAVSQNKIVIYCTHVVSDIENIADEIIMMKAGKIVKKCGIEQLMSELPEGAGGEYNDLERAFLYFLN